MRHGTDQDAFRGFKGITEALFGDLCAVQHALDQTKDKAILLSAPDVNHDDEAR